MSKEQHSDRAPWWRDAVVYQIYPRSFQDTSGDGVGDLRGIESRLDQLAWLGVDAIWISPFYRSPMADFGYDVSDHCDVDPVFGTLDDADRLIAAAHDRGLRVLVDWVPNHTSDQHRWFIESRLSRESPKRDWYFWRDGRGEDPPNNWWAVFGGRAWTYDEVTAQWYLHLFLPQQPDLNWGNLEVVAAMHDVLRFWLDRGVDGFRIDAINFAMHDPELRDNPPAPVGGKRTRPFDFQQHLYNQSHPDIVKFIERLREVTDSYGERFTLAEVGGDHALTEMQAFTHGPARLNSAYGFDFLYAEQLTPQLVARAAEEWPDSAGWPSWAFENHDAPRAISRWIDDAHRATFAQTKILLLSALRGSIILYQGEELGLPQVDVPFDRLQDREAIANWPQTLSRDGARTPMPWLADSPSLGFSTGEPWLPAGDNHRPLAIDRQERDESSVLQFGRECLALRRTRAALRHGTMKILEAGEQRLVFERSGGGETLRCSFNLSDRPASFQATGEQLLSAGAVRSDMLGPYSAIIEEIQ
jgi:alpha-glucosidase